MIGYEGYERYEGYKVYEKYRDNWSRTSCTSHTPHTSCTNPHTPWWGHGYMFASHHYSLGSTPSCMLDVFCLHSQCFVVFPLGFSSTFRRAWNCSYWNCLIRPTGLARTCSGWRKTIALPLPFTPYICCAPHTSWTPPCITCTLIPFMSLILLLIPLISPCTPCNFHILCTFKPVITHLIPPYLV